MPADVVETVRWGHTGLTAVVEIHPDRPVSLRELSAGTRSAPPAAPSSQPLVEVLVPGEGRARASQRLSETAVGCRLRYAGSEQSSANGWHELRIRLRDQASGLDAELIMRSPDGVSAVQVRVLVTNTGEHPVPLLAVTSFAAAFPAEHASGLDLLYADSEWLAENRWTRRPLGDHVPDLGLGAHGQHGKGTFALTSQGTWSSGRHVPMGGLIDRRTGRTWLWQIEHNGPWRWETGERLDGAYVALSGPTDLDHQWNELLAPGESFTTVPVAIAVSDGSREGGARVTGDGAGASGVGASAGPEAGAGAAGIDGMESAAAALTAYRRALVRPHPDRPALPLIFNDYMNTLMGDPTTEKLLPLIDAAAAAGAQVFCVDAGWYDDGGDWWDSVGEWHPSQTRFPHGLEEVLTRITSAGMTPGLWLEPEVIGVRSPMADKLPDAAFLQRGGVRLAEHGRYHLDLRHPAAVAHLDQVVDRLVEELGVGYFKLDYNINPGAGTDVDAPSVGAGLLAHNRAHLAWLESVLDRHPRLVLENCGSGAMRMDYAMLSRLQLQSTSDQQDFLRYPPIAVAAPLSMLPEQAANWAYPQPGMTAEEIAFTMCTGILGRLYLSGDLPRMAPEQLALVAEGVRLHRSLRADLLRATPCWPLGLPGWDDPWLALGLRTGQVTRLAVWRRPGASGTAVLRLPHLAGRDLTVELAYPAAAEGWACSWNARAAELTVTATTPAPTARILHLRPL
ncbi:glycoside hydrolase family 36 protein [Nonomuraea gerenzanensis]|uniref:alpha-galactosidase n=1 Tax=Nonomuraea gerenzanensis TaxID=93944 RepID=A0A1M4E578_9ACTN|nr:glycoside hydrolase family 36 protein [Nonomuraea gerenzanensis]UBU16188.1 alpha-galactosidase [Nonomuraea gerenzanensis]SBO93999.1 Alpha-galactosidase [Nonomuraea gerenzanensis]